MRLTDRDMKFVYFNLGDFGSPEWHQMTQLETRLLWEGAVELMDQHTPDEQREMLEETEQALLEHATSGGYIDNHFVATAVLCLAVRGILYGEIPDCILELE